MTAFAARYFAGDRPVAEEVSARVDEALGQLIITGAGYSQSFPLRELQLESRIGDTPRVIELPNGARLESADHGALAALEAVLGGDVGWLHSLESHRGPVAGALLGVVVLLVAFVWQGLPALAWGASKVVPPSYDQQIGRAALLFLDREWLAPSTLEQDERERISALFEEVVAFSGDSRPMELLFRAGHPVGEEEGIGPNALALPSGVIIITDEMVAMAQSEDELVGVLAHEVGHVVHRHSLRSVIQSAGIAVLVGVFLGDVAGMNVLVETAPAVLANAAYSRRFETAADDFASTYLQQSNRDTSALGTLLVRLEDTLGGADMGYLASHPPAARRAARASSRSTADPP